jgi:hypothetical protein
MNPNASRHDDHHADRQAGHHHDEAHPDPPFSPPPALSIGRDIYSCNNHTYADRTSTSTIKHTHQYSRAATKPILSLTISLSKIVKNNAETRNIHKLHDRYPVQSADR